MKISGILAIAEENGVIGNSTNELGLPWGRIEEDLKYFQKHTDGHIVVMSRKTFYSFGGRPLRNRLNIILSRNSSETGPLKELASNPGFEDVIILDDLELIRDINPDLLNKYGNEIWIIGGAEIFRKAFELDLIDNLYVTYIKGEYQGNVSLEEVKRGSELLQNLYKRIFDEAGKDERLRFEIFKRK